MELAPHQQLFNLGQFINNRFKTAVDAFEAVMSMPQARVNQIDGIAARGEFHETVWWLLLGVELGYFPITETRLLMSNYRSLIQREHESCVAVECNIFPTLLTEVSEKARLIGGPLSPFHEFNTPFELLPAYQTALLISQSLATDAVAGACVRAITFLSEQAWAEVQSSEVLSERVYGLLTGPVQPPLEYDRNLLVAGAIEMLSHMETYKQFFEDLDEGKAGDPADRNRFRFRLGDLQVWRLNLGDKVVESRFNQIIDATAALVESELAQVGHQQNDATQFREVAFILTESWKRNIRADSAALA